MYVSSKRCFSTSAIVLKQVYTAGRLLKWIEGTKDLITSYSVQTVTAMREGKRKNKWILTGLSLMVGLDTRRYNLSPSFKQQRIRF